MIRTAFDQGDELSAAVELRRLFPGITDNAHARARARTIAGWKPLPGGSFGSFGRAYHLGALRVCQRGSRIPTCHIGALWRPALVERGCNRASKAGRAAGWLLFLDELDFPGLCPLSRSLSMPSA